MFRALALRQSDLTKFIIGLHKLGDYFITTKSCIDTRDSPVISWRDYLTIVQVSQSKCTLAMVIWLVKIPKKEIPRYFQIVKITATFSAIFLKLAAQSLERW